MICGRHPIHGDQGILPLPLHRPLHTGDTVGLCPGLYQGPYPEAVRGRSTSRDAENPGNNLYVTGLSPRITKRELEKHFASEGKVVECCDY
ncbi:RNA-binding (RRM/RBD/RNP motifs) family protein [Trifolium repens]|nr:RNA-binding (RRM/RBD/RNP motifs) family protein [Trifolium repens]